ncbi:MAG: hypothetical protein J6P79_05030 [Pseudobutyrivibrio sp.]|nr:hypothetical protein [Pseudobutyrivibrio sp.]
MENEIRWSYKYNNDGLIEKIGLYLPFWDDYNRKKTMESSRIKYDLYGRIKEVKTNHRGLVSWDETGIYSYDSNGLIDGILLPEHYKVNEIGRIIYDFDEKRRLISEQRLGRHSYFYKYDYNKDGIIVARNGYNDSGKTKTVFVYNKYNNISKIIEKGDHHWNRQYKMKYKNNRLCWKRCVFDAKTDWKIQCINSYKYEKISVRNSLKKTIENQQRALLEELENDSVFVPLMPIHGIEWLYFWS